MHCDTFGALRFVIVIDARSVCENNDMIRKTMGPVWWKISVPKNGFYFDRNWKRKVQPICPIIDLAKSFLVVNKIPSVFGHPCTWHENFWLCFFCCDDFHHSKIPQIQNYIVKSLLEKYHVRSKLLLTDGHIAHWVAILRFKNVLYSLILNRKVKKEIYLQ